MKKILTFIIISFFIFLQFGFSFAEEKILNYDVKLKIQKDSSVLVEEKITYDFDTKPINEEVLLNSLLDISKKNIQAYNVVEENKEFITDSIKKEQKHGIFRFIPSSFNVEGQEKFFGLKERKLKFSDIEVYRNGKKEEISEIKKNNFFDKNFYLKIGSEDRLVYGVNEYLIKYKVEGSLRYFNDFDEIYWNVTGNDWKIPIEKVVVHLTSENNIIKFNKKWCYEGHVGVTEKCNIIGNNFLSTRRYEAGEGLTISASFDKGLVERKEIWGFSTKGYIFSAILFLILLIIYGIISIRKYIYKYKTDKPLIPIYEPYKNYHPSLTGYLIDKRFDTRDITAGIINLAVKKYITIEKIETKGLFWTKNTDYIFRLKTDIDKVYDELDKMFITFLFKDENDFSLGGLIKLAKNFSKTPKETKRNYTENYEKYLKDNMIIGNNFLTEVKMSELSKKRNQLVFEKNSINRWLEKKAKKDLYIEEFNVKNIVWILIIIFIVMFGFFIAGKIIIGIIVQVIFFFGIVSIFVMNHRYTRKGWEVKNNLDGYKWFLKMTEEERVKFFNSPKKNPKEFFEYLPYAIAFGVEKEWAEQFKDLDIDNPDWYTDSSDFSTGAFVSGMSELSSNISSTVSSVTTTSSGSSGGGSSGGGAGGGGGGSW